MRQGKIFIDLKCETLSFKPSFIRTVLLDSAPPNSAEALLSIIGDSPVFFLRATPYILAGRGRPSHLPYRPHSLDIPFTFCPGLPLVASGQFEHFSLRVIYYRVRTRLACRCRRRSCNSSFTHVHQFTTRARHDDNEAPRVTVSPACTRAATRTLSTHMHSHTYTLCRTRCFS